MNRRSGEAGYVLIVVAVCLPVLIGVLGLAIDVGHLRYMKWRMQAAADAAAVAGASELRYPPGSRDVQKAAQLDALKNGFDYRTTDINVTVNYPPMSGSCHGQPYENFCVEVIVAQNQPTFFMKIFGVDSTPISARAVGVLWTGPNCIYALNKTGLDSKNKAIKFGVGLTPGGDYWVQAMCGIEVNAPISTAVQVNTNHLRATYVGIVGGGGSSGDVLPAPVQMPGPVDDPLGYLGPRADPSGGTNVVINDSLSHTLQPGVYHDITISCPNCGLKMTDAKWKPNALGPDVTFAPGDYYISGTFSVASPSTANEGTDGGVPYHVNIHGSGVFFYLGSSASVAFQGGNQHFANSYGGLRAQLTGANAGVLFYQAKGNTNSANLSSGFGDGFEGALYFPSAALKYSNSRPNGAQYTIFVADTVEFYRDMATLQTVNYDTSSLPSGSPIKRAVLME